MTSRIFSAGLAFALLLPLTTHAAEPATCADAVYAKLGTEQRLYRSVLYGLAAPEDMPVNSSLKDVDGVHWIKTADNTWRSLETGNGTPLDDREMKRLSDVPPRRGILEIRKALSSELIPSVLQAVRASQCRMKAQCLAALFSDEAAANITDITVQPDGCIEFVLPVFDACRVTTLSTFNQGSCTAQAEAIMDREARMLELLFAYDASYRTLMQFAGTFEGFLADFRFPLLQPLWQMVRTLGQFDNLPCFLAECNE